MNSLFRDSSPSLYLLSYQAQRDWRRVKSLLNCIWTKDSRHPVNCYNDSHMFFFINVMQEYSPLSPDAYVSMDEYDQFIEVEEIDVVEKLRISRRRS